MGVMHSVTYGVMTGVQGSLTGLYQTIEARLALYKPLASLQGRLDLVLAQAAPLDPLASHLAAGPMVSPPTRLFGVCSAWIYDILCMLSNQACHVMLLSSSPH